MRYENCLSTCIRKYGDVFWKPERWTIQQLQVISGHPLLVRAALDAVRQWVYRPTLLNGTSVEVIAPIEVVFTLGR